MPGVKIITVSMDLPFAQKRWCNTFDVDQVTMLSDHKDASFGSNYGTLIKELRIESRAIFVLDPDNQVRHAEYVKEVADFPNYEAALAAARSAGAATALNARGFPEPHDIISVASWGTSLPARWKIRWCGAD